MTDTRETEAVTVQTIHDVEAWRPVLDLQERIRGLRGDVERLERQGAETDRDASESLTAAYASGDPSAIESAEAALENARQDRVQQRERARERLRAAELALERVQAQNRNAALAEIAPSIEAMESELEERLEDAARDWLELCEELDALKSFGKELDRARDVEGLIAGRSGRKTASNSRLRELRKIVRGARIGKGVRRRLECVLSGEKETGPRERMDSEAVLNTAAERAVAPLRDKGMGARDMLNALMAQGYSPEQAKEKLGRAGVRFANIVGLGVGDQREGS